MNIISRTVNVIKEKRFIACISSSFFTGFICYVYGLINNLNNYDSIANTPMGFGATVTSGRWLLYYLYVPTAKLYGPYHLRFLYGFLAIFLYGLATYYLTKTFKIENIFYCIVLAAITISFPAVGSSMYFSYCVHIYALAFLLDILAVLLITKDKLSFYLLSSILIAMSIGIYQAFYPLVISLSITAVIIKFKDESMPVIIKNSLKLTITLLFGYVLNYLIEKLTVFISGYELSNYRGLSSSGIISFKELPSRLLFVYQAFFLPFASHGFMGVTNPILNKFLILVMYVLIAFGGFIVLRSRRGNVKNIVIMSVLFSVLIPPLALFFHIILPQSEIYSIMMFPALIIYYLPCIIFNRINLNRKYLKSIYCYLGVIILLISANYAFLDNLNFNALYYSNRKVENYLTMMYAQIRATDGYDVAKPITFIGSKIEDPTFHDNWKLDSYIIGGYCPPKEQLNIYSRKDYLLNYLGMEYESITTEQEDKYSDIINAMPYYPNSGSIFVTEDCILVKLY